MQIHLLVLLGIFVSSFFAVHAVAAPVQPFCIMVGAIDHNRKPTDTEIDAMTMLNALARNFNNGIRAYYFAVPAVAWFGSPCCRSSSVPFHPRGDHPPRVLLVGASARRLGGGDGEPPEQGELG